LPEQVLCHLQNATLFAKCNAKCYSNGFVKYTIAKNAYTYCSKNIFPNGTVCAFIYGKKERGKKMKTSNTYRRHTQVFMGWQISFLSNGQVYNGKLDTRYRSWVDAQLRVQRQYPDATEISIVKIMSED
jgi:hypothetical protein